MSSQKREINLEIEYLRAVAILMVVLVHADVLFPKLGLGQWTGVDLFFCISGYVISRSFEPYFDKYITEGRWWAAARAFWIRRIFRLAPSAWLWLAVMVLCSWQFNRSGWFASLHESVKTAIYFLTFYTNIALSMGTLTANGFLWSLTLEDQFYFAFPFILLLVRGRWRWRMLLLLIFLQFLPDRSLGGAPYPSLLWATRLDALMWGWLIYRLSRARIYRYLEPIFCRNRLVALIISALLIYVLCEIPKGTFGPWIGHRMESQIAIVSAALVFLASFERNYILPLPGFLKVTLAWIGARSYGLYLIHLPMFGIVYEIWFRLSHVFNLSAIDPRYFYAVSLLIALPGLAQLNFLFIETPLRRVGARLSNKILQRSIVTARPQTSCAVQVRDRIDAVPPVSVLS